MVNLSFFLDAVFAICIVSGCLVFVSGTAALLVRKASSPHTEFGEAYHWSYLCYALSSTAFTLIVEFNVQIPLLIFGYLSTLVGYTMGKRRQSNWQIVHAIAQSLSFICLILYVVLLFTPKPYYWFVLIIPLASILLVRKAYQLALSMANSDH